MSIIIRLQNLPWDASTLNIRQFFSSLSIPDGGVHIIGGEKGDAFIAFSTDEDARQAMKKDGGFIGNTQIKLYLSSKTEMQNVIALAREAAQMQHEPIVRPQSFNQFAERQADLRSRDLELEEANRKLKEMAERNFNSQKSDFELKSGNMSRPSFNRKFESFGAKKNFFEPTSQSLSMAGSIPMTGPASGYGGLGGIEQIKPLLDLKKEAPRALFQRDFVDKQNNWQDRMQPVSHRGSMQEDISFRRDNAFDTGFQGRVDGRFQENFNNFAPDVTMNLLANLQSNKNFADINFQNNYPSKNNDNMSYFNNYKGLDRHGEGDGYYAVLENVPITYSIRDIKSLFKDFRFSTSSLKVDHDRMGKRNGRVYLRLSSITYLENVLKLNGKLAHGMRLHVERCSSREYESVNEGRKRVRSRSRSHSPNKKSHSELDGFFFVIKNVPFSAVFKMIGDAKVAEGGGPYAEVDGSGNDSGHVLVEMQGKADMMHLLGHFRKTVDGSVALIFQISHLEYQKRIKGARLLTRENTAVPIDKSLTCVKMVGLSWNTEEKNIRKFLAECEIRPNCVHMLLEADGSKSGTAYVELDTPEDCHRALERNKQYLGGRYLVLTGLRRQDMLTQIERSLMQGKSFKDNTVEHIKDLTVRKPAPEATIVYMKNLSFRTQLEDILEFFEGFQVLPDSVHLQYKDDIPTGDGMIKFDSRVEARRAISKLDRREMLGRTVNLMF